MIDRVHGHATHLRTLAAPAVRTGLTDHLQLGVAVADFADRGQALAADHAHFSRRHAQGHIIAFLGDNLRAVAGAANDLAALLRLELDVVHRGAQRHLREWNRVTDADIRARTADHAVTLLQALRVQDVALLAIRVLNQGDIRRTIRIVFDLRDLPRHAVLVALEVDAAIHALGATTTTTRGNAAMRAATARLLDRLQQRTLGGRPRDLLRVDDRAITLRRRQRLKFLDRHL